MSLPTDLPGCGEPAIAVFEIFTRNDGRYSLDGRLSVCGAHVVPALTALRAADFEPHQATQEPGRCGDGYDYVARTALTAPASAGQHPRWCTIRHAGLTRMHAAAVGEVELGDETVEVSLADFGDGRGPLVSLTICDDGELRDRGMPGVRAREVAGLLVKAADLITGTPNGAWPHALRPHAPYPGGYLWSCRCGEHLLHLHGEEPAAFHARALAHVNGEDGKTLCATGCGRVAGNCVGCPEVAR